MAARRGPRGWCPCRLPVVGLLPEVRGAGFASDDTGGGRRRSAVGPASASVRASPGLTVAVFGRTFALRNRAATERACSGVAIVTTDPAAPARAVRPSGAGMPCARPGGRRARRGPRHQRGFRAPRYRLLPEREPEPSEKAARFRREPTATDCRAARRRECPRRLLAGELPRTVLRTRERSERSPPPAASATTRHLSPAATATRWCSISATDDSAESTECSTGSSRYRSARPSTPVSSVAENIRRCPSGGVASRPANRGQEPEVGHVVGLVQHGHPDAVERGLALGD